MTYDGRLDEVPGIFALMDPLPEALEANAHLSKRFDTIHSFHGSVGEPVGLVRQERVGTNASGS